MSLYNMVNGVNPATFFILPMLGKHADKYPRFRDCFIEEREFVIKDGMPRMEEKRNGRKDVIVVYTRVGGGNRESYENEIEALQAMPGFIEDFDDDFDCTFASFVYEIPSEFQEDYEKIKNGDIRDISLVYKERLYSVYPKLKEKLDEIFTPTI